MKSVQRFLGVLFVMGYVCSPGPAHAATYYVSTNGSNGRSCAQAQSPSTPKLTLNNAVGCLSAGDTLYVRGGVYDESLMANIYSEVFDGIPSGTSWSNKVRIAAYPGDTPVWLRPRTMASSAGGLGFVLWIDANIGYVEFDGINLDGSNLSGAVLWVSTNNGNNPHHIRFQNAEVIAGNIGGGAAVMLGSHARIGATGSHEIINVTIHGGGLPGQCGFQCASYGIYVEGPNNLIDGCDIYDTSGAGVQIYNGTGDSPDNNIIRNNRIHDITRTGSPDQVWGIIDVGANNQIYNNVIHGINVGYPTPGNAAILLSGARNAQVYNNTLYGNSGWGIVVGPSAYGSVIRNNISYGNRLGNYADYGGGTFESNNPSSDPGFVDAGGGDFSLRSDSPAIDRGAFLDTVQFDRVGVARPQGNGFDIGAYEFNSGGSSPPSPAPGPGSGVSPDGTRVPGAPAVIDNNLDVWTIGPGLAILRNGSPAGGGYGSQILWYQGVVYVLGTDANWWRWTGNTWSNVGPTSPSQTPAPGPGVSPDGTRVPGAPSVIDNNLDVWTIGPGLAILRNGSPAGGGYGSQILWYQGVIYVLGTDANWWRWTGSTWSLIGPSSPSSQQPPPAPGPGVSPDGTRVPGAASVIDNNLDVWTIGPGLAILRNGSLAGGGYGSQILWYQGVIYVLGTDANWWAWTGSTWNGV